jgi:phosphate/sulfate permease
MEVATVALVRLPATGLGALASPAAANRRGQWTTIAAILLAWITTLPMAAAVAFVVRAYVVH